MWILKTVILFAVVLFVILVGLQNTTQTATVNLLHWRFEELPIVLLLFITIAAGMVFSLLISIMNEVRLRQRIWRQNRELKKLKDELAALRGIPLSEAYETDEETLSFPPSEDASGG